MPSKFRFLMLVIVLLGVMSMAPGRCGPSAEGFFSGDPAPDLRGQWEIDYANDLHVEIDIAGQVYTGTIAGTAGSFSFNHDGEEVTFELDCSRPAVVCPSEIFPSTIALEQRTFDSHPHQVSMPVNETTCIGSTRLPDESAGECGGDTEIPCDVEICEGTVTERQRVSVGSISEPDADPGDHPDYTLSVALGGTISGFVTANGACVGLAASHVEADIDYSGDFNPEENEMIATGLSDGEIVISFGGACLLAASAGGTAAAAIAGARVDIWTNFEATPR